MEAGRGPGAVEVAGPRYRGAEAFLYETTLLGRRVLVKKRVEKHYRHAGLDERLRRERTLSEAKTVLAALEAGVPAPAVYYVDVDEKLVVLEFVEGKLLHDVIEEEGATERVQALVERLGYYAGRLHENGVVHGDLTTSNVMVVGGDVFILDFGLAERSRDELDQAVDVHLFLRSLESAHPEHVDTLYEAFLRGYGRARGEDRARRVRELVERIRLMGRYVEERRLVWGRS